MSLLLVAAWCGRAAWSDSGMLQRSGRYIHLTTDAVSVEQADAFVAAFDAAVPQWIEFWDLQRDALDDWQIEAYVMSNAAVFRSQGLIPPRVPPFDYGFAMGNTVWVVGQQSQYYTQHLLLHEGVHALMFDQFGGAGPAWYMEGTAELLATHTGRGDSVRINQVPPSREAAPYWGRFKLMNERREVGQIPTVETVMRLPRNLRGDVESYGWSWAVSMLLTQYPEYRGVFKTAAQSGRDSGPGFTRQLYRRLQSQWPIIVARWRLMCHDLDYGFDWQRERATLSTDDAPWNGQPIVTQIAADQGWQSAGQRFDAGTRLQLTPSGDCTLAETSKPWRSEPAGVTIEYHRGRPLGQLLVCILPLINTEQPVLQPLDVRAVDQTLELEIEQPSWLLFRVNESVAKLYDNRGDYWVTTASP